MMVNISCQLDLESRWNHLPTVVGPLAGILNYISGKRKKNGNLKACSSVSIHIMKENKHPQMVLLFKHIPHAHIN